MSYIIKKQKFLKSQEKIKEICASNNLDVPFLIEKVTKIKHFAKRVSPSPEIFESQKNMVNPKIKSIMNYYLSAQSFW